MVVVMMIMTMLSQQLQRVHHKEAVLRGLVHCSRHACQGRMGSKRRGELRGERDRFEEFGVRGDRAMVWEISWQGLPSPSGSTGARMLRFVGGRLVRRLGKA